jgi:DnaJ domain
MKHIVKLFAKFHIHPNWRAFDIYIKRLKEDTKTAENNPEFYKVMSEMYQKCMADGDGEVDPATFMLKVSGVSEAAGTSTAVVVCRTLAKLPPSQQAKILGIIVNLAGESSAVAQYVSRATGVFTRVGGNVVLVTLSAIYLGWEAIKSLKQWWKGEISGKRCAKQVIDATVSFGAGLAGGVAGAAIGSFAGPVGTLAGSVIGGLITSTVAEKLIDWLTQKIFDLPKDVAVEKAYDFLGVKPSASNTEINAAFRRLCLQYHPDKGGDQEKFIQLQSQMGLIKLHRDEL